MSFFKFITSKFFWWQIIFAIIATILLLCLVMWGLGIYTSSGRTIIVPQFKGFLIPEIDEELRNSNLDYVVIDSIFKENARPGEIMEQIPAAGQKVKKGRKIFLTINAYSLPTVLMPQLVDYSLRNAQVVIETAGLRMGRISYKKSEFSGLVLEQLVDGQPIAAGTRLTKGQSIDLVVGQGYDNKESVVPQCVGSTLREARSILNSAGLNPGQLIYDRCVTTREDTLSSVVYRQNPSGDGSQMVKVGSQISLWLTTDMQKVISEEISNAD
ncbi:MAG: PASTA domain-containing protein [Marinilabiliaceae bacterium]|nr:PASTA domain-containing protein [Marinilabiliaceae bacterium]